MTVCVATSTHTPAPASGNTQRKNNVFSCGFSQESAAVLFGFILTVLKDFHLSLSPSQVCKTHTFVV